MNNELGQPVGVDIVVERAAPPSREPMVGHFCRLEVVDAQAHSQSLFDEYSAATDDGDWTYLPYGPFADHESFHTWLSTLVGIDDPLFFTIFDNATEKAVGLASLMRIDHYAACIEVGGIHFARVMQKTPLATEAMFLMMQRAFTGGYRRYEWKCDDLNAPSRAAASRLGFTYEGTFRQATHYKGRSRDTAWFSIIDSEWPRLRAAFTDWLRPENFDEAGTQRAPLQAK